MRILRKPLFWIACSVIVLNVIVVAVLYHSRSAPDERVNLALGLEDLAHRIPSSNAGDHGKDKLLELAKEVRRSRATPDLRRVLLFAEARPAWWFQKPDIIEISIVYLDVINDPRSIRIRSSDTAFRDFDDSKSGGGATIDGKLISFAFKAFLDGNGQLIADEGLKMNEAVSPENLPPIEEVQRRISPLEISIVDANGHESDRVPVLVDDEMWILK